MQTLLGSLSTLLIVRCIVYVVSGAYKWVLTSLQRHHLMVRGLLWSAGHPESLTIMWGLASSQVPSIVVRSGHSFSDRPAQAPVVHAAAVCRHYMQNLVCTLFNV
jgi:hypothetical protein